MTSWRLRGRQATHSHDHPIPAHARNHAAGRALGRALYEQHSDIDGIWYQSRLTGGECLAVFDRALEHLALIKTGELEHHPELPQALRMHRVGIER